MRIGRAHIGDDLDAFCGADRQHRAHPLFQQRIVAAIGILHPRLLRQRDGALAEALEHQIIDAALFGEFDRGLDAVAGIAGAGSYSDAAQGALSVVRFVGWAKRVFAPCPPSSCEGWWARFALPTLQDWPVDAGVSMSHQERNNKPSGSEYHHGRTAARATETDAGNPAFLGWHAGGRTSPAALRRLRQCVFPAAAVLPEMRVAQGQRVQGQRQGKTLQLCDPSPPGARLHAALFDCRGGTRRRPAHDDATSSIARRRRRRSNST